MNKEEPMFLVKRRTLVIRQWANIYRYSGKPLFFGQKNSLPSPPQISAAEKVTPLPDIRFLNPKSLLLHVDL